MPFINGFRVAYGNHIDQKPHDAIRENSGQDPDINKGYGGKFVWIVPTWTDDPNGAVSGFEAVISDTEIQGMQDLAEGAGGKFRYLRPIHNGHRAVDMGVLRFTSQPPSPIPHPFWNFISGDINAGRKGDFLYAVCSWDMS